MSKFQYITEKNISEQQIAEDQMSGEKEEFIVNYLLEKIESGSYKIGERIPSEYQLARKFNIDKGTANRAVSQLVTRGYFKRTRGAGGTILIRKDFFPEKRIVYTGCFPTHPSFYSRMLQGLINGTHAAGYNFTIVPMSGQKNLQVLEEQIESLKPSAIFIGGEADKLKLPDVPIFCLDTMVPHGNKDLTYHINPDNFMAGKILIEEIWKRGHRKVLHFSSPACVAVQRERFLGARERAKELGIEFREINLASLPIKNQQAFQKHITKLIGKYTVIICENDIQAADLIGQCLRIGINVPQDISVCGYISGPEFHHFYRITSIEYDPSGLGEYTLSLALRVLNGENDLPHSELLPVTFFEGETLAVLNR